MWSGPVAAGGRELTALAAPALAISQLTTPPSRDTVCPSFATMPSKIGGRRESRALGSTRSLACRH